MLTVGEGGTKFVGVKYTEVKMECVKNRGDKHFGLTFFQKYGFSNFYIINMAALFWKNR